MRADSPRNRISVPCCFRWKGLASYSCPLLGHKIDGFINSKASCYILRKRWVPPEEKSSSDLSNILIWMGLSLLVFGEPVLWFSVGTVKDYLGNWECCSPSDKVRVPKIWGRSGDKLEKMNLIRTVIWSLSSLPPSTNYNPSECSPKKTLLKQLFTSFRSKFLKLFKTIVQWSIIF